MKGIRVIDLTRALSGPYCTMMLGDYGADVVKIEMPNVGDDTRNWAPPYIEGQSAYFLSVNRNKRGITLDLKSSKGRKIFLELTSGADVVVENFTSGVTQRLKIDYEEVRKINPQIIYCSISGFGQTGPYRDRPAYDQIMQGMGGLMSITGMPNGEPVKVGVAITDIGAGMFSAYGILAALFHRSTTGIGQYLDISMLDCEVAWLTYQAGYVFATGKAPGKAGSAHPNIVPYQTFLCQDGRYINIAVGSERLWPRFCKTIDRDDLRDDPRFVSNDQRVENRDLLVPDLQGMFLEKPSLYWLEGLTSQGIPCGPIQDVEEVLSDPQVLSRGMVEKVSHPTIKELLLTGIPIKFSESPGSIHLHPPLLGEHTIEILTEMGYSHQDVELLRSDGVI